MIAAALACLIAGACLILAARRWRALRTAASAEMALGAAGQARIEQRAVALLGPSEGAELVRAIVEAPSRAHAVAELNERLSEARATIDAGAAVPRAAARVAVASGTLLALVEVARHLPAGGGGLTWALLAFGVGLVASVICTQLGRLADSRAQESRQAWNDLARALRAHMPAAGGSPGQDAIRAPSVAIPDQ